MLGLKALNLPNSITIMRIFLVPIIVWTLITNEFLISFSLFLIAGISDFIDGWLARLKNIQTLLGAYLDPLADKLLMGSVYLTLGFLGHLPLVLVLIVVFRDILIITAIILAWLVETPLDIAPLLVSKINTFVQITLVVIILADLAMILNFNGIMLYAYYIVGLTTIASTFAYLLVWGKTVAKE